MPTSPAPPRMTFAERFMVHAQIVAGLLASGHYSTEDGCLSGNDTANAWRGSDGKERIPNRVLAVIAADDIMDDIEWYAEKWIRQEKEFADEEAAHAEEEAAAAATIP